MCGATEALANHSVGPLEIVRALRRAADGDQAGMNALLKLCEARLKRIASRECDGALSVSRDDLIQESLIHVSRNVPRIRADTEASMHAWLRVVFKRVLADAARRDARGLLLCSFDDAVQAVVHAHGDAAEISEGARASIEVLLGAMSTLAPENAAALWAHTVLGAPWSEIAETLCTTPSAAKRRVQRASERIRRVVWRRLTASDKTAAVVAQRAAAWMTERGLRDPRLGAQDRCVRAGRSRATIETST